MTEGDGKTAGLKVEEGKASTPMAISSKNVPEGATPVENFVQLHESFKKKETPAVDKDEIRKVFEFFDENKDGLISQDDLRLFMDKLGLETTEEEIFSMVDSVDANGDGSIDFEEFASLYKALSSVSAAEGNSPSEEEDLKEAFAVFDRNGDGNISAAELQTVLLNLGMTEGTSLSSCQKMIENVDVDGNGQVDFGEFKKLMGADFSRG